MVPPNVPTAEWKAISGLIGIPNAIPINRQLFDIIEVYRTRMHN